MGSENIIRSNPASLISKPRNTQTKRPLRLESGELEKLLRVCPNPWSRQVVLFAIETGMRRGELLSLTWENVHLGKRYVHLPDTTNGDSSDVPLSPQALELTERPAKEHHTLIRLSLPLHYEG